MDDKDIVIMENINAENERLAEGIRQRLRQHGIYAVNVIGAPGVGKTQSLLRLIRGLPELHSAVIEGDIQSDIDTEMLKSLGIETVQINTGGACHLDGNMIAKTLDKLALESGLLFIENIGNLVCPAAHHIGEEIKIVIVTVTDGADKPYKYPRAFEEASAVLLNKADLLPYVEFDMAYFAAGLKALNEVAPLFIVSAKTGAGFAEVCAWLKAKL